MGNSDGSGATSTGATKASSTACSSYLTFRALVESADRKFARARTLPSYDTPSRTAAAVEHCYRKVFKAYTRLWKYQQQHRAELVESGMRRWEIGEVASRIGQLYYGQYQRTSEARFLLGSYVFYEAILSRGYFEDERGKGKGKQLVAPSQKADLGLRAKELRFYARFLGVALLLKRTEFVRQLVDRFMALLDDCRVSFPGTDFREWKLVLHEILRFLKADASLPNSRPLRYNALFDSHPSSDIHISRFHPARVLKLEYALLSSFHRNEVKYAELSLDTFRMLQCLEWEPSGSFCLKAATEPIGNGGYSDQSGASGLIDINLAGDMTDPNLPPNPRKAIFYRPSVPQLISLIATICEGLSSDNILLIYLSASGKSEQNATFQKEISGAFRTSNVKDTLQHQHHDINGEDSSDCGDHLCFGSRGTNGVNKLHPEDLIPFTRRPLFLIIDSDSSNAFKVIHGAERGETAAMLLSPLKPILQSQSAPDPMTNGSQFTSFLTAPLQAFCQLVGLSNLDPDVHNNADSVISAALSKWETILCTSHSLDKVWAQVFLDPLLRRLILRFIFCRSVLHLFIFPGRGSHHLPNCLPKLPDSVSPDSSSVQSSIHLLAESLGVVSHFHFTTASMNSS